MGGVHKFDLIKQRDEFNEKSKGFNLRVLVVTRILWIPYIYLLGLMQTIISYETRVIIQVVSSRGSKCPSRCHVAHESP